MKHALSISALLLMALSSAPAQLVTSHAPTAVAKHTVANSPAANAGIQVNDRPVARVNGAVLTDRDLLREMFAMFPYAQQHGGAFPKDLEPQIRQGAIKMIVFEELVYQEAERRKMTIPPERIARAQMDFKRRFSPREYQQYLDVECKGSAQVMRQRIRRSMLIDALLKSDVESKAAVSLAEAKAYYDKNPKSFEHNETFTIQTISIMPPPNSSPEILKEAAKRAEDAARLAKATKTFKEFGLVAEKMSDDDWHVNMGDRKAVERAKLPPPVVEAALKMKPGEVSGLIQLGTNYTLFRLNAHTPAGKDKFETVKTEIRTNLQKSKNNVMRTELNQKLQKNAKVEVL